MAASGGRYRLAGFETLLDDCQLLLGCPPPTANITRQQFNMSILVRHKPVLKSVLEPFCLCRLSGRNGGQFMLSERAGLEERTFLRRFHKATGLTSTDYAQRIRVSKARDLLQFSPLSVDAIAWEVGYLDPAAF